ncbi:MAG: aldehyde dehydrogenase family protein [Sphingomicrobium sp.]
MTTEDEIGGILDALGVDCAGAMESRSPIDGGLLGTVTEASVAEVAAVCDRAAAAFIEWRKVPAPRRGKLVRLLGEELRAAKAPLARLVTLEAGKIVSEGLGEVQEMIDICDFAVGLSRQLYGLTIASERPEHRMIEQWHPLGPVAVISAFNFPVAVWAWNAALALVCGDPVIWKPSEKTPLTAAAVMALMGRALARFGDAPDGLVQLLQGGREVGAALAGDQRAVLVSATGSTRMGRELGPKVAARFGRSLLELGGNNAMIVSDSADLALAERAILFAAAGTAGQRCTSLRRLIVHRSIGDALVERLARLFDRLPVGDPRDDGVLVGPLIDEAAVEAMARALETARGQGGVVHGGAALGERLVRPALVEMAAQDGVVLEETFAPILYVLRYDTLDQAIALNNGVAQGLSSSIFTNDLREAERFVSATGSDCGIANVNIGPSGAEIGGAFGGEKETGGGRESGSDSWRAYMRRSTNTINYGSTLPLAQGVRFELDGEAGP